MASLTHIRLVRLIGISLGEKTMLITPLMPLGNLLDYVRNQKRHIGSSALLRWCYQIASGMEFLESAHIVHRDLAARNVLVHTPMHLRICDFGLAKILDYDKDDIKANGEKVPIRWLALESLTSFIYNHKTDVWSYGVTLWELFTFGERPYATLPEPSPDRLVRFLKNGERLPQPAVCTIDVYMDLVKCWTELPDARPTFTELKNTFKKMCQDPPRWLAIQGDKLLRLESYTPSDQERLLEEMALGIFSEEDDEGRQTANKLGRLDVVPAETFFSDPANYEPFEAPIFTPMTPHSPGLSGLHRSQIRTSPVRNALQGRGAPDGSPNPQHRYQSDPLGQGKKFPDGTLSVPCSSSSLPPGTDDDNYLIANSKLETATNNHHGQRPSGTDTYLDVGNGEMEMQEMRSTVSFPQAMNDYAYSNDHQAPGAKSAASTPRATQLPRLGGGSLRDNPEYMIGSPGECQSGALSPFEIDFNHQKLLQLTCGPPSGHSRSNNSGSADSSIQDEQTRVQMRAKTHVKSSDVSPDARNMPHMTSAGNYYMNTRLTPSTDDALSPMHSSATNDDNDEDVYEIPNSQLNHLVNSQGDASKRNYPRVEGTHLTDNSSKESYTPVNMRSPTQCNEKTSFLEVVSPDHFVRPENASEDESSMLLPRGNTRIGVNVAAEKNNNPVA